MSVKISRKLKKSCSECGCEVEIYKCKEKQLTFACSKECRSKLLSKKFNKKIKVSCVACGKDVYYKKSHLKQIKNPCCSYECSGTMRKSIQRSKGNGRYIKGSDEYRFFYKRAQDIKHRASAMKIPYNIDAQYLLDLYNKQNGTCFYSGMELNIQPKKYDPKKGIAFDTLSVDRIIPEKGYIKENIVLCLNCINLLKAAHSLEDLQKVFTAIYNKQSNKKELKYKKLTPTAKDLIKTNIFNIGYDLYVDRWEDHGNYIKVYTGIAVEPEQGYFIEIAARSSIFQRGLILHNGIGIIDENYRGEIIGILYKTENYVGISIGDRLLQAVPRKHEQFNCVLVDELSSTDRGSNGFGSSGV